MPPHDLYSRPHAIAFLRDVVENPDDDAPRLIFADWLDEHGDAERAEFIRLQIELEKLPAHSRRAWQIRKRERELEQQHSQAWRGRLAEITSETKFRRGFVEEVKLGVRQLMDHGGELFALAPVRRVHLLRLTHSSIGVSELAASGLLRRLRGLSLRGSGVGSAISHDLIARLDSEALEELDLTGTLAGAATLAALAGARRLPRLRTLRLGTNQLGGALANLLPRPPVYALRELDLSETGLAQADLQALWDWPGLASVEALDLSDVRLGVRGTQAMVRSPHLRSLKCLDLTNCAVGQGGARAIADCASLAGLEVLRLNGNALKRPGLEALLAGPHLTRLAELQVAGNELRDGAAALADWPRLAGVTILNVGNNNVSATTVEALTNSPHLGAPVSLSFSWDRIGAEGVRALAACPKMAGLQGLNLSRCHLGAAHHALLDSPHLGELWELDLRTSHRLDDDLVARLKARFPHILL